MTSGTEARVVGNMAVALLESMRAVEQALNGPAGLPAEQLVTRVREWQRLVVELDGRVEQAVEQAAELAILCGISQVMNASLDLTETLNLVMDSLVHLTGAERGCLALLDEQGNLEVRAARNFDREGVESSELELSHTVVREAVEGDQPVLTTNAQLDPRFAEQESVIGYQLRSIVCVPLHIRGRVTGALYLDNRMREGVFSRVDLSTLTAFADQAAIALENAYLYTVTDQSLAMRVKELTTLEQIGRELNASLDLGRVLDLTLSWALRATRAEGGALSILDSGGAIRTVSRAGGGCRAEPEPDVVERALSGQEPIFISMDRARMLVPIRYQERVLGLLDLWRDGGGPFRPDHARFASRLADHAAVAIENARLYEEVHRANEAKSEFVSFVSHELHTPMMSIHGYAELLEREIVGPLTDQQVEFLHKIIGNVERMQVLVSDLQDVTRLEAGKLWLEMGPTTLVDALESALQATQALIEARSQRLTVEVPEDLPPTYADPARLAQVLINLLSNACKYTPEGGKIHVRAWLEGEHVHCAVSDTGVGISPEDQARLFTKYFRSEDAAVREMPGTGLGLRIVKSLVELQGGEMEVESRLGEGTTCTFAMPVAEEGQCSDLTQER